MGDPGRAGRIATAVIVVLLAAVMAGSAATAGLVDGLSRLPLVAFIAAFVTAAFALSPARLRWAVPVSLALAVPVSLVAAGWRLWQLPQVSLDQLSAMLHTISLGQAGDTTFPDFLFFLGIWGAAGWLGWFAIRARRGLLALVPPVAIIAISVLNVRQGQVVFVLGLILCFCALLLVGTYNRSIEGAHRRGLWLHDDVRWNYWESGVAVSIVVLAVTAFLPPVSTVNRTLGWENRLSRASASGRPVEPTSASATSLGYSPEVRLAGPLHVASRIVLTYTSDLDLPEPYYFVGDTAAEPVHGAWVPANGGDTLGLLPKNTRLPWTDPTREQKSGRFDITVRTPPSTAPRTLFYPGQLEQLSVPADLLVEYGVPRQSVVAVARTQAVKGVPTHYQVTVDGSTATAAQLAAAGTSYPAWVQVDAQPLDTSYVPARVLALIHQLALQAVAGVPADPYDRATAIQNYLRSHYTYTLDPKRVPKGEDALQAFLEHRTGGYCVYFATAMADMLRSLGIPVVLANGFGPGSFDSKHGRFDVWASDAHTWPQVYFPGYGWIPFEPTPQPGFGPIPRGGTTPTCATAGCGASPVLGALGGNSQVAAQERAGAAGGGGPVSNRRAFPVWMPVLGGLLLLLLAALALALRWLRPSTLAATWRRTGRLARLAGIPVDRSESPLEFGDRLARLVPTAAPAARTLAGQVTVAAYAPRGVAPPPGGAAEAWATIRGQLLRRAVRRTFRPGQRQSAL